MGYDLRSSVKQREPTCHPKSDLTPTKKARIDKATKPKKSAPVNRSLRSIATSKPSNVSPIKATKSQKRKGYYVPMIAIPRSTKKTTTPTKETFNRQSSRIASKSSKGHFDSTINDNSASQQLLQAARATKQAKGQAASGAKEFGRRITRRTYRDAVQKKGAGRPKLRSPAKRRQSIVSESEKIARLASLPSIVNLAVSGLVQDFINDLSSPELPSPKTGARVLRQIGKPIATRKTPRTPAERLSDDDFTEYSPISLHGSTPKSSNFPRKSPFVSDSAPLYTRTNPNLEPRNRSPGRTYDPVDNSSTLADGTQDRFPRPTNYWNPPGSPKFTYKPLDISLGRTNNPLGNSSKATHEPIDISSGITDYSRESSSETTEETLDRSPGISGYSLDSSSEITDETLDRSSGITDDSQDSSSEITGDSQDSSSEITDDSQDSSSEITNDSQDSSSEITDETLERSPEPTYDAPSAKPRRGRAKSITQRGASHKKQTPQPEDVSLHALGKSGPGQPPRRNGSYPSGYRRMSSPNYLRDANSPERSVQECARLFAEEHKRLQRRTPYTSYLSPCLLM